MLCAISGEAPQEPVVSKKSGLVYEKRLITKYIDDHGKEPGTEDDLSADDLLPLKTALTVRPRPPTLTSIPALLATFQNEWDALALETYNLSQQLDKTREELASALYQHDAAVRVIARLTKERDEARAALSAIVVSGSGGSGSDDRMAVDTVTELPEDLKEKVEASLAQLSKSRKKRPIPEGWITPEAMTSFEKKASTDVGVPNPSTLSFSSGFAAVGSLQGDAAIYSVAADKVEKQLPVGEPVTASAWSGSKLVFATAKGSVKVYDGGAEVAAFAEHAGPVTGLAVHPSGELLASVGADKALVIYDLAGLRAVTRTYADSALNVCGFHPDGHLLATGSATGEIKFYMTSSLEEAAVFDLGAPLQALVFSENGFWFAATAKGTTTVTIFDLRKEGEAAKAKVLDIGGAVLGLAWDYSAQFLATTGPNGTTIQQYSKSAKKWSEPLRVAVPGVALQWGEQAQSLVVAGSDGVVSVVGA
ncbi:hypothetical protein Cpir12675_004361 [Ceratocystis pirilliformis]|uniref:Pre-mRNA-processing factor 19 n=1 Tax=Ceratocystis pirilliformis TaxID=259994 RepID=A0ABR3YY38_9PEZI